MARPFPFSSREIFLVAIAALVAFLGLLEYAYSSPPRNIMALNSDRVIQISQVQLVTSSVIGQVSHVRLVVLTREGKLWSRNDNGGWSKIDLPPNCD